MDNKGLKVLLHASTWFAPFLVPFVLYLVVDDHEVKKLSVQAVLFQLVMSVLLFISFLLYTILFNIIICPFAKVVSIEPPSTLTGSIKNILIKITQTIINK